MIVKIEFDPETAQGRKILAVLTADDKKPTVILADPEGPTPATDEDHGPRLAASR
jgi:hypothetical protein